MVFGRGWPSVGFRIALIVLCSFVIIRLSRFFLNRLGRFLTSKDLSDTPTNKRIATLFGTLRAVGRFAILLSALVACLYQVGVDIGPILAGAGIAEIRSEPPVLAF